MSVDFGVDVSTPDGMDLDPYFVFTSGEETLAQALLRRLVTPRGSLALVGDDPAYGFDLRAVLNDDEPNMAAIENGIVEQFELDERVERATAAVTFDDATETLRVVATAYTAAGPFRLTLDVSSVTAVLLAVEAA